MNDCNNGPSSRFYILHSVILVFGALLGILAAYYFTQFNFDYSSDINEAKSLGIVSKTILAGYSKKRDIYNYIAMMGFPILIATGIWSVWALSGKHHQTLNILFPSENLPAVKTRSWMWIFAITCCAYLYLSFNLNDFHDPNFNSTVGAWPFLGEEGENLAWVQCILHGGVYGKDFHCLYGPMLIYPLAWFMKLFGATVASARQYTYVLNLMAYGIIIVSLYNSLRTKTIFIFAAVIYLLVFNSSNTLSPNTSYLRVALGFAPIFLAYFYLEKRNNITLVIAGIILGQCCLFSHEVGACSILAVVAMLAVIRRHVSGIGGFCREVVYLLGAGIVSVIPMLVYLATKGALGVFFSNILEHPRMLGLGYQTVIFPDFKEFLHAPWSSGALFHYWVIFVYIASAVYLIPLVIIGRRDRDTLLKVSILVFGILLFRAALARSDEYHVFFVSQPAFLLVFLFLDNILTKMRKENSLTVVIVNGVAAGVILMSLYLLSVNSQTANIWDEAKLLLQSLSSKFSTNPVAGAVSVPQVQRGAILYDPQTAENVIKIGNFLTKHTQPGDYVYFFPNEAAYYFLFDRNNPTRYVYSYFAATREQRLELITELEKNRPEYVIYSRTTWRIDGLSEQVVVPEVLKYITTKYHPVEDLGDTLVLKRSASSIEKVVN